MQSKFHWNNDHGYAVNHVQTLLYAVPTQIFLFCKEHFTLKEWGSITHKNVKKVEWFCEASSPYTFSSFTYPDKVIKQDIEIAAEKNHCLDPPGSPIGNGKILKEWKGLFSCPKFLSPPFLYQEHMSILNFPVMAGRAFLFLKNGRKRNLHWHGYFC